MTFNRRQLMWAGAAGALAATLPKRRVARAANPADTKNLIVVLAGGGWDTTYSIDPKPQGGFIDSPAGTITTHGSLDILEDPSRPAIGAYFARYGAITAVVRGIRMPSVSHVACTQAILTGARNETSPDVAAIVAHAHGPELPIPYLVLGNNAFAGPYAASMGRVGATNQLVAIVDPAAAYPVDSQRTRAFSPSTTDDAYIRAYTEARAERVRAVRGDRLRELSGGLGTRGTQLNLPGQRQLALDALSTGVSQAVMMSSGRAWDTHEVNADQGASHDFVFANLTALLDALIARPGRRTGTTMLDDTVIAVVSEMGRTPKLNGQAGKDHWPVTSAMVIGGNVTGNRAYGGTSDTFEAELVDFTTGSVSASGRTIEPRHFAAGVLAACGVDAHAYLPEAEVFDAFVA